MFVDLDHFKTVNDRFGHAAGDEVLRVTAERLAAAVRPADVVCRLGDDELAVLVMNAGTREAQTTADRVRTAVCQPIDLYGTALHLDASVGVAVSSPDLIHPEQLVRRADQAMYRAKETGRGRSVLATD